jgi:hypothetical protein
LTYNFKPFTCYIPNKSCNVDIYRVSSSTAELITPIGVGEPYLDNGELKITIKNDEFKVYEFYVYAAVSGENISIFSSKISVSVNCWGKE